ncbi:MAG: hypothetical protein F2796_01280, partial [Actinobacteria bacterium]|nr:hypothetical protein [Actinomycetota bacterium]
MEISGTAGRSAALAIYCALALPAAAVAPQPAGAFRGITGVDGPSADVRQLGGLDVARDGDGLLAWVRRDGGADHAYLALLRAGVSQGAFRIDAGQPQLTSAPAVAAANDGRMAVVWANARGVFAAVRSGERAVFGPPQQLAGAGADAPVVDLSPAGVGYAAWVEDGDVRTAYLPRTVTDFRVHATPVDADPAREAGTGTQRPRVTASGDGIGLVVWGERELGGGTRVLARRLVRSALSQVFIDATASTVQGRVAGSAELPEVRIEDDSSYAWVVMRQQVRDATDSVDVWRGVARRLRGSRFETPLTLDGDPSAGAVGPPRIALNGRGRGIAVLQTPDGSVRACVIRDDVLGTPVVLGAAGGADAQPGTAFGENSDGVVAWLAAPAPGSAVELRARLLQDDPALAQAPPFGELAHLSEDPLAPPDPLAGVSLGTPDPLAGLQVAADRAGDTLMAVVLAGPAGRTVALAAYDRAPGAPVALTTTWWRARRRPVLTWTPAAELWGPVTYSVLIDGVQAGTTTLTTFTPPMALADGLHRWQVIATDPRDQTSPSSARNL